MKFKIIKKIEYADFERIRDILFEDHDEELITAVYSKNLKKAQFVFRSCIPNIDYETVQIEIEEE